MPKKLVKKLFDLLGLEVHRKVSSANVDNSPAPFTRNSLSGVLRHVKQLGFVPQTVIDVGGAFGLFSAEALHIFPHANYQLLEPLEEYKPYLDKFVQAHPRQAQYVIAAAGARSGEISINVHPDLVGSSTYLEEDVSDTNGVPRVVKSVTLDELITSAKLAPPYLVKIDVQGAELDVLVGFERNLANTEFLLLEVSFFGFFLGGPQFYDVVAFMKSKGFVAYDISELQYRLLDGALSQTDLVFVKENGQFRREHYYATAEQRVAQFEQAAQDRKRLKEAVNR